MKNGAKPKQEWSTDGPVCPHCSVLITPDENFFYDQSGYRLDCDCGGHFNVRPDCSWSWTTQAITFEDG